MTDPDPRVVWEAISALQQRLEEEAGFGGLMAEDAGVTVFWKGAPPPAADRALDEFRATLPCRLRPAAHSEADLLAEADRLLALSARGTLGYTIASIGPRPDGSGLEIEVMVDDPSRQVSLPTTVDHTVTVVADLPRAPLIARHGRRR
jgi:hypothetical protein